MAKRKPKKTATKTTAMAKTADRHILYQAAVQCIDFEIEFIEDRFKDLRGKRRKPFTIREDFCGTALFAAEWCKSNPKRHAIGVDLCSETLKWGMENIVRPAGSSVNERVSLLNENVLSVATEKVDVACAMNFSYCVFKSRDVLRDYFKNVLKGLKADGLFFLDLMGGTTTIDLNNEYKYLDDCQAMYEWEHESFNPITNEILCHIHFEFDDGSRMDNAFTYDWRLWTLPELQEILLEAGFSSVHIFWEEFIEDNDPKNEYMEGSGIYREVKKVDQQESWLAYIVAAV